jgi:hypothetical protein
MTSSRRLRYGKRSTHAGGTPNDAGFGDAVDIEQAAHAMKRIALRTRVERQKLRDEKRAKPSMPKMPWEEK